MTQDKEKIRRYSFLKSIFGLNKNAFYVDNFNNKFLIILNKYERGRAKAKKAVKIILSISVIAGLGFSTVQAAFNATTTNTNQFSKKKPGAKPLPYIAPIRC
ncbi:hypothetical protein [Lactobacillus helsingborgensis]|uniref:hypothetical protein n=1 Tax=Lactobacillus helsingborgensis TaxID=1218494 RepID=UPI0022646DBE|nr:hypothetical protein [Lactobacillus helsingborgensis]UZX30844.1 hypothetical protein LDX52_05555 [Lactobacillus helsingborgensis]